MEIFFDNRETSIDISDILKERIYNAVKTCLIQEKGNTDYEISISFVNEEEIKNLNSIYRKKDSVTDVLSFPTDFEMKIQDVNIPLGDVVICSKKASEQALEYGQSFEKEVVYLTIHSIFHLFGYDHEEDDEKKIMRLKEKEVLKAIEG